MTPGELRRLTRLSFDHPNDGPPEALPEDLVQRILAAGKAESKARTGCIFCAFHRGAQDSERRM